MTIGEERLLIVEVANDQSSVHLGVQGPWVFGYSGTEVSGYLGISIWCRVYHSGQRIDLTFRFQGEVGCHEL